MRLHNMAAGGRHEAREEDGVWCESGSARGHDKDMAKERWHHSEEEDIKCLLNAGEHESSPAQRTSHPGYLKRETASFDNVDWRPDSIVSPPPESTAVHILCGVSPIHLFPFTQALVSYQHSLCAFTSYCSPSFISIVQKLSSHNNIATFFHFHCQTTLLHYLPLLQTCNLSSQTSKQHYHQRLLQVN
jgi:hypothetical protein